ncbi:MAG: hypothetical protein GF353_21320 [Candidatus Lokiarchaeota archaeon]|nr:hypothetical protein [Candidatus Lokiarchaeota archaeon]
MANDLFWSIIEQYNKLMKSAISGPNCINPSICRGDCCSIKIDIPKTLAEEYIKRGYATEKDFIRGDVFSFSLRFDEKSRKCFLFDKKLNGCKVHNSGIKPPQCWIYPTNFENPEEKEIKCKKIGGWQIKDKKKASKAQFLLEKYIFLCQIEAKREQKRILNRIIKENGTFKCKKAIKKEMMELAPSSIAGFKDSWKRIKILGAQGYSLQMKKFCLKYDNDCKHLKENFLYCPSVCEKIAEKLFMFLLKILPKFVKENGASTDGEYPLYRLFEFAKNTGIFEI